MSIDPPGTEPHTITFHDPGDVIAGVPAMLGFVPERSLVLVAFDVGGRSVGVTMRHDLDLDADGIATEVTAQMIGHLCELCLRDNASGVFAIVVDDRFDTDDPCWDVLFDDIDDRLEGLGLSAGFVVAELCRGRRWRTGWGSPALYGHGGLLDDPRSSALAVAHAVATGQVIAASRAEMAASITAADHCADPDCDHHAVLPDAADVAAAVGLDDAELLRRVLDAVVDGVDASTPCEQLIVLEVAIAEPMVRDALLALAVSEVADDAENLFTALTRRLRGHGRACAATLLGHLNYVHGNGAMAGVAFDCALAAQPGHTLAQLLDRSLRAGLRPSTLAELLPTSYAAAEGLGVILPAPRHRDAS